MRMLRLTRSNEIEKVVVGVKSMIKKGEKRKKKKKKTQSKTNVPSKKDLERGDIRG